MGATFKRTASLLCKSGGKWTFWFPPLSGVTPSPQVKKENHVLYRSPFCALCIFACFWGPSCFVLFWNLPRGLCSQRVKRMAVLLLRSLLMASSHVASCLEWKEVRITDTTRRWGFCRCVSGTCLQALSLTLICHSDSFDSGTFDLRVHTSVNISTCSHATTALIFCTY